MRTKQIATLLALAVMGAGCSGQDPSSAQIGPFKTAIESYLRAQNMAMRPDTFDSLRIDGDRATANVRMAARDVAYGVRPRWTFAFQKRAGHWKVLSARRPKS